MGGRCQMPTPSSTKEGTFDLQPPALVIIPSHYKPKTLRGQLFRGNLSKLCLSPELCSGRTDSTLHLWHRGHRLTPHRSRVLVIDASLWYGLFLISPSPGYLIHPSAELLLKDVRATL